MFIRVICDICVLKIDVNYIWCNFYVRRAFIEQFKADHSRTVTEESKEDSYAYTTPQINGIVDREVATTITPGQLKGILNSIHECDEYSITINGLNNDNFMSWAETMENFVKEDETREEVICANISLTLNSDGTLQGVLSPIFDCISLKKLVLPEGIIGLSDYCFEKS